MTDEIVAIIYCRVSSQDQLSGTSLETQERICREFCERSGYAVQTVFFERGESAKTADRTELKRAIATCSKSRGRVRYFVVYKLDRFSRNTEDHVTIRALLRRAGTELVSATEPIDSSPTGKLMEAMLAGIAEFDNSVRTERTKTGMLERVRQGVWVWPAPIGYRRVHQGANLTPHPDEAEIVRTAFRRYGSGVCTYEQVATFINDHGLRLKNGRKLLPQTIAKIVHNPVYTGIIRVWGQDWPGSFPALVTQAAFNACQSSAETPRPHAAPRYLNNPLFPLRRLIVCSLCGEGITGSRSTGRNGVRRAYYHHRKQGCRAAKFLAKTRFEDAFVDHLKTIALRPGAIDAFVEVVRELVRSEQRDGSIQKRVIGRQLAALKEQRERVFRLHREGVYSDEEFREQLRLLDLDRQQKSRLLEEAADLGTLEEGLQRLRERFTDVGGTWKLLEPRFSERLEFQREIFAEPVPFDGQRFGTARFTSVYGTIRAFDGDKSSLVALCQTEWTRLLAELRGAV